MAVQGASSYDQGSWSESGATKTAHNYLLWRRYGRKPLSVDYGHFLHLLMEWQRLDCATATHSGQLDCKYSPQATRSVSTLAHYEIKRLLGWLHCSGYLEYVSQVHDLWPIPYIIPWCRRMLISSMRISWLGKSQ
jgi:hypothetical protein